MKYFLIKFIKESDNKKDEEIFVYWLEIESYEYFTNFIEFMKNNKIILKNKV